MKTDVRWIARRLAALQEDMPPMPSQEAIYANLVRLEKLWTPAEYEYIKHFHQIYGFNEQDDWLRGDQAYDEWQYWHTTAVKRYHMSEHDLSKHLAALPTTRPRPWKFEDTSFLAESKARGEKSHVCMPWDNTVPYDHESMRARGWQFVDFLLPGKDIIFRQTAIFPFTIYALMQKEPDVVMLFSSPGAFESLTYYIDHKAALIKKHKIREIDAPLDYKIYVPDKGYSYDWKTGKLLEKGCIAGYHVYAQDLAQIEAPE